MPIRIITVTPKCREYDWEMHEKTYDVEIGEKKSNGEISYYDGLNENDTTLQVFD